MISAAIGAGVLGLILAGRRVWHYINKHAWVEPRSSRWWHRKN